MKIDETNFDALGQIAPNIDVGDIENDHMYLMSVAIDCSGSMSPYVSEMKMSMTNYVKSIKDSKSDDEMLVSRTDFSSNVTSSGFQVIDDFGTDYSAGGTTHMYDAIIAAAYQLTDYMNTLNSSGVRTRGGLVIFSDGDDIGSTKTIHDARDAIAMLKKEEIVVAFVAFGPDARGIANDLGITDVLETKASESELRRVWGVLSKSAISSSKSAAAGVSQNTFFDV